MNIPKNLIDAAKEVGEAIQDIQAAVDEVSGDPQVATALQKLADAGKHLEQAVEDLKGG